MNNNLKSPNKLDLLTGEGSGLDHPSAISTVGGGGKFDHNGEVLQHPGNTFICHVNPQSAFFQALSDLHDALRALPQSDFLTFLPKSSFHMTVFCGISGDPLGVDGWPEDIPRDATLDTVSSIWHERLSRIDEQGGFSVVPHSLPVPYSLKMKPASDADAAALLDTRQRLEEVTGLVRSDLQSYQFHVTFAYLVRWMDADEAQEMMESAQRLFNQHLANIGPVTLGPVEFCTFSTMHNFTAYLKGV